jgi:hypothetical protein
MRPGRSIPVQSIVGATDGAADGEGVARSVGLLEGAVVGSLVGLWEGSRLIVGEGNGTLHIDD